jgi:hypothetical protein
MSWLRTINKEYKDNTKKTDVGNPNNHEGEEGDPPENEGETNGQD